MALLFLGVGAVLSAASPPERSLGAVYRIVMFHGGMAIVAFAALALAGLAGVAALLVRRTSATDALAASGQETGALTFVLYFASSYWAMAKAWGGPLLEEPRFKAAVLILFVGGVAYVVSLLAHHPRVRAALTAGVGGLAIYELATTPLFFHPRDPVRGGGSEEAKVFFYLIVASLAISAVAFWWMRFSVWVATHDQDGARTVGIIPETAGSRGEAPGPAGDSGRPNA